MVDEGDAQAGPRGGQSKYELYNKISTLTADLKAVQNERDTARADKTRLAAWLKLNYPEAFRAYFLSS